MTITSHFQRPPVFEGPPGEQLIRLLESGYRPLTAADLMRRRLENVDPNSAAYDFWWRDHFVLGDALAYGRDGRVKVVSAPAAWWRIASERPLVFGSLPLLAYEYTQLPGVELDAGAAEQHGASTSLLPQQVPDNPFWQALARDPALLDDYCAAAFEAGKQQEGLNKMLGVCVTNYVFAKAGGHALQLWHASALQYCGCFMSDVDLITPRSRLAGVSWGKP